jgi:ferric-dicitrate binding protein FerR (iron transport regulator)
MVSFQVLLDKYKANSLDREELEAFLHQATDREKEMANAILQDLKQNAFPQMTDEEQRNKMLMRIVNPGSRKATLIRWNARTSIAAAVILLLLGAGIYSWVQNNRKTNIEAVSKTKGSQNKTLDTNSAILTLADGTTVVLDSASGGTLASQGSIKVIKLNEGQLAFRQVPVTGYNTITTPRGIQYQIILPNNSKVWMNAASSLRFPVSFTGPVRHTELQGEAYFEIAENSQQPFIVNVNGLEVKALGTSFNINAYEDEDMVRTTLLTGRVQVKGAGAAQLMAPGQQIQSRPEGTMKLISNYNSDDAIAWKNGYFRLTSADVPSIMRQIARWYDVDIVFEGKIPSRRLTGEVRSSMELAKVVEALEASGIKIKMGPKKLIVRDH